MLGKTVLKPAVIILELNLLIIHKNLLFKVLINTRTPPPIKKKNNLTLQRKETQVFLDHLPLLTKMFLKMIMTKVEILDSAKLMIKIVLVVVLEFQHLTGS